MKLLGKQEKPHKEIVIFIMDVSNFYGFGALNKLFIISKLNGIHIIHLAELLHFSTFSKLCLLLTMRHSVASVTGYLVVDSFGHNRFPPVDKWCPTS